MIRAIAGLLTLLAMCAPLSGRCSGVSEYQLKAVFLFNFSEFVSWPPRAFPQLDTPLVIGVLGHDPFGGELDAVVRGEHVGSHALVVQRYQDVSQVGNCQILFIDRSQSPELHRVLDALRGRAILTVSDIEGAAASGVMIDLVRNDDHIRLLVNIEAARASGLGLSAKLLRPAQIVSTSGD